MAKDCTDGCYLDGTRSHKKGGIKSELENSDKTVEMESEEYVVCKKAANDNSVNTYTGTNREIVKKINNSFGGNDKVVRDSDNTIIVESGQVVINKKSMNDPNTYTYTGTNKQILSEINQKGGGVAIYENGGIIKKGSTITHKGKEFEVIGASTGKLKAYLVKDKNGVESVIMDNQLHNDKYSQGGNVMETKATIHTGNKRVKAGELQIAYFKDADFPYKNKKVSSSKDAYDICKDIFSKNTIELQESFYALYLNRRNEIIAYEEISKGGTAGTVIDNKIILSIALKVLAHGIIIAHNHPSGNLQPSDSDINISKKLKSAATYMDISLLDSLIITNEGYYSLADEGALFKEGGTVNGYGYEDLSQKESNVVYENGGKLKGGLADNKTIEDIAREHGVDVAFANEQLEKGIAVEMEHTDNKEIAKEIALDHLSESINYYIELEKMENKLEGGDSENIKENTDVELNKLFRHNSWFKGQKKTISEALDYFAETGDFYVKKEPSKTQSNYLLDDVIYDVFLYYSGKDGGRYKLSKNELNYFLKRRKYWKDKREKYRERDLLKKIDLKEELRKLKAGNTFFRDEDKIKSTYSNKYVQDKIILINKIYCDVFNEQLEKKREGILTKKDFDEFKSSVDNSVEEIFNSNISDIATGKYHLSEGKTIEDIKNDMKKSIEKGVYAPDFIKQIIHKKTNTDMGEKKQDTQYDWVAKIPESEKYSIKPKEISYRIEPNNKGLFSLFSKFLASGGFGTPIPLMGIYFNKDGVSATESHIMLHLKEKHNYQGINVPEKMVQGIKMEGKSVSENNILIDVQYPKIESVLPTSEGLKNDYIETVVDFLKLKTYCEILKRMQMVNPASGVSKFIYKKEEEISDILTYGFKVDYLINCCDAALKLGNEKGLLFCPKNNTRAVIFVLNKEAKTKDIDLLREDFILSMPMILQEDAYDDLSNSQTLSEREIYAVYQFKNNTVLSNGEKEFDIDTSITKSEASKNAVIDSKEIKTIKSLTSKNVILPITEDLLIKNETLYATDLESDYVIRGLHGIKDGIYEFTKGDSIVPSEYQKIEDFPKLKNDNDYEKIFTLNRVEAVSIIQNMVSFVSDDEMRPIMGGVNINDNEANGKVTFASTDAHVLEKISTTNVDIHVNDFSFTVPIKFLKLLDFFECENIDFYLSKDKKYLHIECGNKSLYIRLIDGNYPAYNTVIPSEKTDFINVLLKKNAIKKAETLLKPYNKKSFNKRILLKKDKSFDLYVFDDKKGLIEGLIEKFNIEDSFDFSPKSIYRSDNIALIMPLLGGEVDDFYGCFLFEHIKKISLPLDKDYIYMQLNEKKQDASIIHIDISDLKGIKKTPKKVEKINIKEKEKKEKLKARSRIKEERQVEKKDKKRKLLKYEKEIYIELLEEFLNNSNIEEQKQEVSDILGNKNEFRSGGNIVETSVIYQS